MLLCGQHVTLCEKACFFLFWGGGEGIGRGEISLLLYANFGKNSRADDPLSHSTIQRLTHVLLPYACGDEVVVQKYGEAYADAVSSMLIRQSYLLKEDGVREMEAKIAAELSELPHSIPATRILKTLLILDTRRPPVEVAFQVSGRRDDIRV